MAANPHVVDVDETNFEAEVLLESQRRPVLVDFWADWCQPCKTLGPVLERLAAEYDGRFRLVKIDTETNPRIAQAFAIQSIPAVKLFVGGRPVDEFTGALPEAEVRRFLDAHLPKEADLLFDDAIAVLDVDPGHAANVLAKVIELDPEHGPALLALTRLAITSGNVDEARAHAEAIPKHLKEANDAAALLESLQFSAACQEGGGLDASQAAVVANPDDLDARHALACCHAAAQNYQAALDEFLEIAARNRDYKEEAARRGMVAIFSIVGQRSPLADEYRRKLAMLL